MDSFIHVLEDGIERYSFPSALNPHQLHYIDRDLEEGTPWALSVVNYSDSLTFSEALTLVSELRDLIDFMNKLNKEAAK